MEELLSQGAGESEDQDDVKAFQDVLVKQGVTSDAIVGGNWDEAGGSNGKFGPMTEAAVKELQKRAGLTQDGVVGPKTKAALLASGMTSDDLEEGAKLKAEPGSTVKWYLDLETVPSQLQTDVVVTELQSCFDQWGAAAGLTFVNAQDNPDISICFANILSEETAFDGPGGALANA